MNNSQVGEKPIHSNTSFQAIWSQACNFNNLTLRDVKMLLMQDDYEFFLPIGASVQSIDFTGHNNPWIIAHYGNAQCVDARTGELYTAFGVFLQQSMFCVSASAPGAIQQGVSMAGTDMISKLWAIERQLDGSEVLSTVATDLTGYRKIFQPHGTSCFTYSSQDVWDLYHNANTYASLLSDRTTSSGTTLAATRTSLCLYDTANNGYCSSVSGTTANFSTYAFTTYWNPKLCCFIERALIDNGEQ